MTEWIVVALMVTGTFFFTLSAIGLLRLPDVYSRMHAVTKASTLGMAGVLSASLVFFAVAGHGVLAEIVTMWSVFLTNPVGGHMIARSAYLVGIPMCELSIIDQLDRAGEHGDASHDTV